MDSRAGLSRTLTLVVALSLTAVSTGVVARAFGAADTRSAIDLDCSGGATIGSEIPVSREPWRSAGLAFDDSGTSPFVGVRFEAAIARINAQAQPDAAPSLLIERIRKVE
ncbi:hypothetical protein [Bradyrhizobium sp.]|uniref:hypothetical protein n=1 Tax=Bradyrhizobium sp. TaxID=376 RepID=UPI00272F08A5|nr:hypothetical protein [Bradyrhizobium sp.]MDP1869335.1 hypothetical protein [Bradyrhizobium sp.]MDP3078825.1 hypothetical protein [Bradyrhizobium sp.]